MKSSPLIVAVNGSPSANSRTRRVLEHVAAKLAAQSFDTRVIHVRDLPASSLLALDTADASIAQPLDLVTRASAVVIATPIYKASFSGLLKSFLDLLPKNGLDGKLVLPLATGGSIAHTLALDYALRPVLTALGASQVLPGVYAAEHQVRWSEDGGLDLDADLRARLREGTDRLADALPEPALVLPAVPPTLHLLKTAEAEHC
jgi:FMN reductase